MNKSVFQITQMDCAAEEQMIRMKLESFSEIPVFQTMIIVSLLALIGNGNSLYLINKTRSEEAHMKASWIFTSNDVIVNLGVIIAGGLVYATDSRYPDLIIGSIVFWWLSEVQFAF